jgi:hypothetical protein
MPILTTIPQCHHIKDNGIRCGSPALRGKALCYFHLRQARRHPAFYISPLTDRASIQTVLSQVIRAAFAGHIEDERLRTMVYTLQIAISNLRNGECGVPRPGRVAQPSSAASGIRRIAVGDDRFHTIPYPVEGGRATWPGQKTGLQETRSTTTRATSMRPSQETRSRATAPRDLKPARRRRYGS